MSAELSTRVEFDDAKVALIRRTVCPNATNDQLSMFIHQCRRTGLDPLARQIYAINMGGKLNIQTSIDGFRLIAERSGKYAGQAGPFWCGADGEWHDVWLASEPPVAAKVGTLRSDFKEPIWSVARFASYSQSNQMWKKMPDLMLAKCAEALSLRRAFPQDLSGLYTSDEMAQADHHAPANERVAERFGDATLDEDSQIKLAKDIELFICSKMDQDESTMEAVKERIDDHAGAGRLTLAEADRLKKMVDAKRKPAEIHEEVIGPREVRVIDWAAVEEKFKTGTWEECKTLYDSLLGPESKFQPTAEEAAKITEWFNASEVRARPKRGERAKKSPKNQEFAMVPDEPGAQSSNPF